MSEELIKRLRTVARDEELEWGLGDDVAALLREAADALSRPAPAVQVPEGVAKAMGQYARVRDAIDTCGDGGCLVKRPAGMHTNGGCKCPRDWIKAQRMMVVGQALARAVESMLAAAPTPATVATEVVAQDDHPEHPLDMVAQGGGVDAEKVMAPITLLRRCLERMESDWLLIESEWGPTDGGLDADIANGNADEIRDLRALLASPAGMGWIPVGDRLPEDGTVCLVALQGEAAKHLPVQIAEWVVYTEAPVEWSSATVETGEGWAEHEFEDVTHWQPLPSPPAIANQEARDA